MIDEFDPSVSIEQLQKERRKLAKRANQRLLRLERASSKITGEGYSSYGAYTLAQQYLGEGKTRFVEREKYTEDRNTLIADLSALQAFLGSKSSTVKGQREIENVRLRTFEEGRWGVRYKTSGRTNRKLKFAGTAEFYNFLNSETFKNLKSSGFTSDQIVEMYDDARERNESDEETVIAAMEEALERYRKGQEATLKDIKSSLGLTKLK